MGPHHGTVVSNQFTTIGIDLATQFRAFATPSIDTYPAELADDIEALDAWIGPAVNKGVNAAALAAPAGRPPAPRCSMRSPSSTGGWPATASCSASTAHRGRRPAVRDARALRRRCQRRPGDQPRPRHVPRTCGPTPVTSTPSRRSARRHASSRSPGPEAGSDGWDEPADRGALVSAAAPR